MKQQTLAMASDVGFKQHRKPTRRDEFLKTMDALVPWSALREEIAPHYPKAGNGRPPIGLERMLRIHFVQHWFNLADLGGEPVPDLGADRPQPQLFLGNPSPRFAFLKSHGGIESASRHSGSVFGRRQQSTDEPRTFGLCNCSWDILG